MHLRFCIAVLLSVGLAVGHENPKRSFADLLGLSSEQSTPAPEHDVKTFENDLTALEKTEAETTTREVKKRSLENASGLLDKPLKPVVFARHLTIVSMVKPLLFRRDDSTSSSDAASTSESKAEDSSSSESTSQTSSDGSTSTESSASSETSSNNDQSSSSSGSKSEDGLMGGITATTSPSSKSESPTIVATSAKPSSSNKSASSAKTTSNSKSSTTNSTASKTSGTGGKKNDAATLALSLGMEILCAVGFMAMIMMMI